MLIWSLYLEISGFKPSKPSAVPSCNIISLSKTWHDCSHEDKLIQKDWVTGQSQNRCTSFSVSLLQKVHFFTVNMSNFFFKKLLLDSLRCKNLKLKTVSVVLFVHWKDNWYVVSQLIVMLTSSNHFCWLEIGRSPLFDTSFLFASLFGFVFSKSLAKKNSYLSGGLVFGEMYLFSSSGCAVL